MLEKLRLYAMLPIIQGGTKFFLCGCVLQDNSVSTSFPGPKVTAGLLSFSLQDGGKVSESRRGRMDCAGRTECAHVSMSRNLADEGWFLGHGKNA